MNTKTITPITPEIETGEKLDQHLNVKVTKSMLINFNQLAINYNTTMSEIVRQYIDVVLEKHK